MAATTGFDAEWLAVRRRADERLADGPWAIGSEREYEALTLLRPLKDFREFRRLADIGERVLQKRPTEPYLRRLLVQAQIESGKPGCAIAVARDGLAKLADTHPEWSELQGLIGRAYKQIAIDDGEPAGKVARDALRKSIAAYSKVYQTDKARHHWHGVNLAALLAYAKRHGVRVAGAPEPDEVAREVIGALSTLPEPDRWSSASLAEASLALGAIDEVHRHLKNYLSHPGLHAFEVGSTLRQFEQVWELGRSDDPRRSALIDCLRIRYCQLPGAHWRADAHTAEQYGAAPTPEQSRALEAILGASGPVSYAWYKLGLDRARSVAAVRVGLRRRIGTGFLVSSRALGFDEADEAVLVTNFHVINRNGANGHGGALRPDEASVAFEAVDANASFRIRDVLWESRVAAHDACVLRLVAPPALDRVVPLAPNLPVVEATAKVFIIGHPDGGDLAFSIDDTALLDHEGPPHPAPANGVCRVHYRTPTEKGSSGSPVFNAGYWEAIALHHAGGELPALNGKSGTVLANEGISFASIVDAIRGTKAAGSFP